MPLFLAEWSLLSMLLWLLKDSIISAWVLGSDLKLDFGTGSGPNSGPGCDPDSDLLAPSSWMPFRTSQSKF